MLGNMIVYNPAYIPRDLGVRVEPFLFSVYVCSVQTTSEAEVCIHAGVGTCWITSGVTLSSLVEGQVLGGKGFIG